MPLSDSTFRTVSTATTVWGVVFAIVHFYWAAGGGGPVGDIGDTSFAAHLYVAFIAVIGLLGAAVARGLAEPWGSRFGPSRLRTLARLGGIALLIGVISGVGRWIADGSLGDDGAAGVVITAYFLFGGLMFSALGWRSSADPVRLRASSPG